MRRFRNVTGGVPEQRRFYLQPNAPLPCCEITGGYAGRSKAYPLPERDFTFDSRIRGEAGLHAAEDDVGDFRRGAEADWRADGADTAIYI